MSTVDHYLTVLAITITAAMFLRFILNSVLCRSLTERDPFNKLDKINHNTIFIAN